MVIFGIKMTAIKFPIERWDLISKMCRFEFLANFFFIIFTYIFGHRDLDIWPKVTKFNRVRASVISNHLAKTASKSVHPFGWNLFTRIPDTHTQTHRHTDKLQWKYNPSKISLRCKKKKKSRCRQFPSKPLSKEHTIRKIDRKRKTLLSHPFLKICVGKMILSQKVLQEK